MLTGARDEGTDSPVAPRDEGTDSARRANSGVTCRGVDPAIVSYSRVRLPLPIRLSPAATRRTKNTTARTVTQSNVPHPAVFTSVLASDGCDVVCAAENAISSMRVGDA